jgi:hypothetical protein
VGVGVVDGLGVVLAVSVGVTLGTTAGVDAAVMTPAPGALPEELPKKPISTRTTAATAPTAINGTTTRTSTLRRVLIGARCRPTQFPLGCDPGGPMALTERR